MIHRAGHHVNDVLAFLLELTALAVLARWGFTRGGPPLARIALGVGAPLTAAVVWGLFAAPRARFDVPLPAVLAVKAAFFLAAVLALYAMRHPSAAVALALVVTANIAVATAGR